MSSAPAPLPGQCANRPHTGGRRSQDGFVLYLSLIVLCVISMYVVLALTAARIATVRAQRRLGVLQHRVLARSALEVAMAGVAAERYRLDRAEGDTALVEFPDVGKATVVMTPRLGWLDACVRAVRNRDTLVLDAVIGARSLPFADCALTVAGAEQGVSIGPRAKVVGNVASPAGTAIAESGGVLYGNGVRSSGCDVAYEALVELYGTLDERFQALRARGG